MSGQTSSTTKNANIIPIKLGIVNCYILKGKEGYILIDTGYESKRKILERKLEELGIPEKKLNLIILTHQDFDHTGNAAYLRDKFNTKIAMHRIDSEAVERGDMLWNRKMRSIFSRFILKIIFLFFRIGKFQRFSPDIYLEAGSDLSAYGINIKVINLPGHSKGSIGILTANNDLFCGDLFMNTGKKPAKSSLIDIKEDLNASVEKLREFQINTVYPGHGPSFELETFWFNQ